MENAWACRANLRAAMWRSWQTCSRLACDGRAYRREERVSLKITKRDVDIRKDLSDNVVMHCLDLRNRRTHDEGVDCVSTTDDVKKWCLHQRISWQSSLASPDGVTGGTSLRMESRALCKTRSEEDSQGLATARVAWRTKPSSQSRVFDACAVQREGLIVHDRFALFDDSGQMVHDSMCLSFMVHHGEGNGREQHKFDEAFRRRSLKRRGGRLLVSVRGRLAATCDQDRPTHVRCSLTVVPHVKEVLVWGFLPLGPAAAFAPPRPC